MYQALFCLHNGDGWEEWWQLLVVNDYLFRSHVGLIMKALLQTYLSWNKWCTIIKRRKVGFLYLCLPRTVNKPSGCGWIEYLVAWTATKWLPSRITTLSWKNVNNWGALGTCCKWAGNNDCSLVTFTCNVSITTTTLMTPHPTPHEKTFTLTQQTVNAFTFCSFQSEIKQYAFVVWLNKILVNDMVWF